MLNKIERMNQQFGSLHKNGAGAPKLTDEMINMMFAENNGIGVDKLASLLDGMGKVEPAAMKQLIDQTQKKLKVFDNDDDDCEGASSDNDDDDGFEDDDEDEEEEAEEESSSRDDEPLDNFKELEPVPNGIEDLEPVTDISAKKPKEKIVEEEDATEKKAEPAKTEEAAKKE